MSILKVQKLTKVFSSGCWPFSTPKSYTIVDNISFDLPKGEILGFLGPNGAGKTTTIQMLLGTLTPTSGSIDYFGKDFAQHRMEILKKVSYASGYDKLPARLTVWENLDVVGRIYGLRQPMRNKKIEELLKYFGMWSMSSKEFGSLSAGQATRVMLAKAFLPDPEIVLLDEPTASLDPEAAQSVRHFVLAQKKERGVSVLVTSHNMDEVTEICDRVLVLKNGSIIANNTPEQLAQSISNARINLMVSEGLESLMVMVRNKNLVHHMHEHSIEIDIAEHAIAPFLGDLAEQRIMYSRISIDKPTLEDYFLSIAK
jgi:ABC-2 type transport system ATP-binding protein